MALPKLDQPTFTLTLPSTKKQIRYRPFTVREEKLLMIAQASGEREDYVNAFKQLITNCCIDPIDVDALASYDIEYFFVCLRAKSVSNVIKMKIKDEYEKDIEVTVNLDEIKVHESTVSNKIVLDAQKNIGMVMKYPTFAEIVGLARREAGDADMNDGMDLFISLIDVIWEGETVYPAKESTKEELAEFVANFNGGQVELVEKFLEDLPFVYVDITYTDSKGDIQSQRVTGIESFFA